MKAGLTLDTRGGRNHYRRCRSPDALVAHDSSASSLRNTAAAAAACTAPVSAIQQQQQQGESAAAAIQQQQQGDSAAAAAVLLDVMAEPHVDLRCRRRASLPFLGRCC